jgi:hypothetical protein
MSAGLPVDELERLWSALGQAVTAVGPEREALFLAKLVLLLGNELGTYDRIAPLIETALRDL